MPHPAVQSQLSSWGVSWYFDKETSGKWTLTCGEEHLGWPQGSGGHHAGTVPESWSGLVLGVMPDLGRYDATLNQPLRGVPIRGLSANHYLKREAQWDAKPEFKLAATASAHPGRQLQASKSSCLWILATKRLLRYKRQV